MYEHCVGVASHSDPVAKQESCSIAYAMEGIAGASSEQTVLQLPGKIPLELTVADHAGKALEHGSPVNRSSHCTLDRATY